MSNKPKICVVIPAKNLHEIKILISEACQHQADIIELRLDYLESLPDFSAIREITDIPLIATCRRYDQRGYKKIPELIRINLLINAIRAKFNYIDLEVNTPHLKNIISKIRHLKGKIIISKHNFNKVYTKKELNNKLIYMRTFNADFYKIIGIAKNKNDNMIYLNFLASNKNNDLICFGMGKEGALSRIFSPLFGGVFTYASILDDENNLFGQIPLSKLRYFYQLLGYS